MRTKRDRVPALILDGRSLAADLRIELAARTSELREAGVRPKLAVLFVGENEASLAYVHNLGRTGERVGIGRLRLQADRDVRPEAAAEVVAMQGRLKYLGVQDPSLDAIYTRYFESRPDEMKSAREGARDAA